MNNTQIDSDSSHSSLDVLEQTDHLLLELFDEIDANRGDDVDHAALYGAAAKQFIRDFATREAALVDVTSSLAGLEQLQEVAAHLEDDLEMRRTLFDEIEHMGRGTQPMNLNVGQDFDGPLSDLISHLRGQILWEISEAIPNVRSAVGDADDAVSFKDAKYISNHAPTNLSPHGPKWYERAPFFSRIITFYDRLRDFPAAATRR